VDAVHPLIEARKLDLKLTRPAMRLRVLGDVTRLAQVVSNLLNNAAKFTPERGLVTVTIETERNADPPAWVRIVVTDSGIGMVPGAIPEMFNLFAQADATLGRQHGGLGIGLTLVRSFVEMHGGSVTGASDGPGRGSTFVVRLPLMPPAAEQPSTVAEQTAVAAPKTPRRVIVVDDNPDVAESLAAWLADDGHDVRVSANAEEALREAKAFRPEVMFVDIGLPDMTGYEAARRLRAIPEVKDAVLIAVTGYGQEDDRRRSFEAGFDRHWIKPLTGEMLSELLTTLEKSPPPAAAGPAVKPAKGEGRGRRSPRAGGRRPAP
jgi:CheY-like chemotaxis protein